MYNEETKSSRLAEFLSKYDYVLMDTCSLMEDSFPEFMDQLVSSKEYWKDNLKVVILSECLAELKKHSKNKKEQKVRISAVRAIKIVRHDKWHSKAFTLIKSSKGGSFADNAIFTFVSSLRIQNKFLVVTQDKTLTTDLLKLNRLDSQHGRYLEVYRLKEDSTLEMNPGENSKNFQKKHENASFKKEEPKIENKREAKPSYPKPLQEIIANDEILMANLNNPNYKKELKIKDIETQLSRLKSVDPNSWKEVSLKLSKAELEKRRGVLSPSPKPIEKFTPKKDMSAPNLFSGVSPSAALSNLAFSKHVLIRGEGVEYLAMAHGPLDLTKLDLIAVDKNKDKPSFVYETRNAVKLSFVKDANLYKVSIEEKKEIQKSPAKASLKTDKLPKKDEKPLLKDKKTKDEKAKEANPPSVDPKKKVKVLRNKKKESANEMPDGLILVSKENKKKAVEKVSAEEILKADRLLKANSNNPNYPKEKVVKDIKDQLSRLKKVDEKQIAGLKLHASDLNKILKDKKS